MRIKALTIENYRTLESITLDFPSAYAAICGPNDSGKTNVVRSIRHLVKSEGPLDLYPDEGDFSLKDDFPKWKETDPAKRRISFKLSLSLDKSRDVGFYQFVIKHLSIDSAPEPLDLGITVTYQADAQAPSVVVTSGGKDYSDLGAQEVLKKLQSSRSILFHNSTQVETRYMYPGRSVAGHIREIAGQHEQLVASMMKTVNRGLAKISKAQQSVADLEET